MIPLPFPCHPQSLAIHSHGESQNYAVEQLKTDSNMLGDHLSLDIIQNARSPSYYVTNEVWLGSDMHIHDTESRTKNILAKDGSNLTLYPC